MKICVIGNSHVGALKRGWDLIAPQHPKVEITFFAHRGDGMASVKVENGSLVPTTNELNVAISHTSGGLNRITPDDYDIFLIYGLRAKPNFVNKAQFISSQARFQALEDLTLDKLSFSLLIMLRELTDKKVYIGHDPLPAAITIKSEGNSPEYMAGIALLNKAIYKPMSAELVTQPLATIVNQRSTHPAFSQGSKRLAIGDKLDNQNHSAGESGHMNDEFGKIWLTSFLSLIGSGAARLEYPASRFKESQVVSGVRQISNSVPIILSDTDRRGQALIFKLLKALRLYR